MKQLQIVARVLLLLGGINWGLIGLFGFDLIGTVFQSAAVDRLIYVLIGLAAIYKIVSIGQLKGSKK